MDRDLRQDLAHEHHHADIPDDQGVHRDRFQRIQIFFQGGVFVLVRHGIDRQIDFDSALVRIGDGVGEFFRRKIIGGGAHTEGFSGEIDGVRAVQDRGAHLFKIAGRREDFRSFHSFFLSGIQIRSISHAGRQ